jgi:hypothetical protein
MQGRIENPGVSTGLYFRPRAGINPPEVWRINPISAQIREKFNV